MEKKEQNLLLIESERETMRDLVCRRNFGPKAIEWEIVVFLNFCKKEKFFTENLHEKWRGYLNVIVSENVSHCRNSLCVLSGTCSRIVQGVRFVRVSIGTVQKKDSCKLLQK